MRTSRSAVGLLSLVVSISGCLTTSYVGTYRLENAGGSQSCAATLSSAVGQALADFGFAEDKDVREAWMKDRSAVVAREFAQLQGASHLITVAVTYDPTSVRIRDWDSITETSFVQAVESRIEGCIRNNCDRGTFRFEAVNGDAWW